MKLTNFVYAALMLIGSITFMADPAIAQARVDEPAFSGFQLPLPNPAFPNCPGGYFVAVVDDGTAVGLTPGIFGLALTLNSPGTLLLEGGLNFGGSLDGSQPVFAGFNFQNAANEQQRVDITLTGNPRTSRTGTLPVRIRLIRQPSPGVNEPVSETVATLSLTQPVIQQFTLSPSFYVVIVSPEGAASVPGGSADGQVYVSLSSQFVNRPGGGFFGGVVIGGYHAVPPFGDNSGFGSFCLGTQHSATAQVYSAPTYGVSGARDLRLRLLDHLSRVVVSVPAAGSNSAPTAAFNFSTSGLTATFTDSSTDSDGTIASRSWNFGDGTSSTATNPIKTYAAAGAYPVTLTVTDNVGATNSTTRQVSVSSTGGGSTQLVNGIGVNGSTNSTSENNSWADFTVQVPAGASNLTIATSNATGDVDLYVRFGAAPTLTIYDCRPFTDTGNEACGATAPSAGTYYARVYGYAVGPQSFRITASWSTSGGGGQLSCANLDGAYVLAQNSTSTYLGFFGSEFASESIMNRFGTYGDQFASGSVRNQFGTYGSSTGPYSAQNAFTSTPPVIRRSGIFLAYLSTNTLQSPRLSLAQIDAMSCNFFRSTPLRP